MVIRQCQILGQRNAIADGRSKLHISVPTANFQMVALKWLDIVSVIVHINNFQMVALKCPDQELEATVERWQEWDLGETRHEVIDHKHVKDRGAIPGLDWVGLDWISGRGRYRAPSVLINILPPSK